MLLAEEKIEVVVDDLRQNHLNVGSMLLKVNTMESKSKKPNIVLNSQSEVGVEQDSEYYENISDNLMALQHQILEPLFDNLQGVYEVNIPVEDDGHFITDHIEITMQLLIPENVDKMNHHLFTRLKPYCLLYKFIDKIEFKGSYGHLRNVLFYAKVSPKELTKIFRNFQVNYNILNHWMMISDKVRRDFKADYHHPYSNSFRVVGGKMHYHNRKIRRTKKFNL